MRSSHFSSSSSGFTPTSSSIEPRVDTTLYPVVFRWTHPCQSVSISGSFNRWRERLPLIEEPNHGNTKTKTFSIQLDLSAGLHTFKYLVDDSEWKYDPESAFVPDCHGNINNFINVIRTKKEDLNKPQEPIKTKIKDAFDSLPKMNPDATKESLAIMKEDLKACSAVFAILKDMVEVDVSSTTSSGFVSSPYSSKHSTSMRWNRNNHNLRNSISMNDVSTPNRAYSLNRKRSSFDNDKVDTEYGLDISDATANSSRGLGRPASRCRICRSKSETFLDCQVGDPFAMLPSDPASAVDRMKYSFSHEGLTNLELIEGRPPNHVSIDKSFTNNQEQMREARFSAIMLTASVEHFGGDLVTHEHSQRQMMGGHCSYITYGGDKKKERSRTKPKLLIFLVGLPGRGKTFIGHMLSRHLTWMGKRCKVFNVGQYRRKTVGAEVPLEFWDPKNTENYQKRMEIAVNCLHDALNDLESNECDCAIYDGSNVSLDRRMRMREEVTKRGNTGVLFIESICNDPEIIATAIHDMKLNSEDYREFTLEEAAEDYFGRIQHYESIYEPLDERENCSFIKVIDIGRQLFSNQINGYLQSRIMFLMANIHMKPCPIWLTRHGESIYNTQDRIGGDSPLSTNGMIYAEQLDKFINAYYPIGTTLSIWTSTMLRTGMTIQPLAKRGREIVKWKQLDEIDAGICDGLTYEEVVRTMPEEYIARKQNKLFYRYPRGESYQDVIHRLEPVITEMMRMNEPLLIVAHQAILRVIYGYLTNRMPEDCPVISIPLHTVIQITLKAYKSEEVWHRPMQ